VILHRENRQLAVAKSFHGSIVEVDFRYHGAARLEVFRIACESMVLRGD
jgi:hypothetical protein